MPETQPDRSPDVGPSDVGPSDVGPSDVGPSDVGPSDVGPSDVGPSDWGYDEAHDDVRRTQDPLPHQHRSAEVVTETSDREQDYSYDLAHDLPPARR